MSNIELATYLIYAIIVVAFAVIIFDDFTHTDWDD